MDRCLGLRVGKMKQIGIITALLPEAACLTRQKLSPGKIIRLNDCTRLLVSGIGAERAKQATRQMIDAGSDVLLSCGTAGAIAPGLQPGDLIVPETVIAFNGEIYQTAKYWRSSIVNRLSECPGNIYLGKLADSMHILTTIADKYEHHTRDWAQAVDMESASIAEMAAEYEIPCVIIRIISDSSAMAIPDIALKVSNPYGQVSPGRLLRQLLTRPGQIPDLYRLGMGFRAATKTMRWIGQRLEYVLSRENGSPGT